MNCAPMQIRQICKKFGADAIVSLDAYRYANYVKVNNLGNYEYFSTYDAAAIHYWRLYNCHTGHVMNVHSQNDTIFWEDYGNSINQSLFGFPSFRGGYTYNRFLPCLSVRRLSGTSLGKSNQTYLYIRQYEFL